MENDKKKMTIWEGITAVGVIGGVVYIIFTQMSKKNPRVKETIKEFMANKEIQQNKTPEIVQQIYDDKRTMM